MKFWMIKEKINTPKWNTFLWLLIQKILYWLSNFFFFKLLVLKHIYTTEISFQMESTLKLINNCVRNENSGAFERILILTLGKLVCFFNTCVRNEDPGAFGKILIPTLCQSVCFYSSCKVLKIKGRNLWNLHFLKCNISENRNIHMWKYYNTTL